MRHSLDKKVKEAKVGLEIKERFGRMRTLVRATRWSGPIYLIWCVILVFLPVMLNIIDYNFYPASYVSGDHCFGAFDELADLGEVCALVAVALGCAAGIVAASTFDSGRKGELFLLLPKGRRSLLVSVALCELCKALVAMWISMLMGLGAELAFGMPIEKNMPYFPMLLIVNTVYTVLYFSVGLFCGTVSGRTLTRALSCIACILLPGLLCFAIDVHSIRHGEVGAFGDTVFRMFSHNSPLAYFMTGNQYSHKYFEIELRQWHGIFFFTSPLQIFGIAIGFGIFFGLSVYLFGRVRRERREEHFSFGVVGGVIKFLLVLEAYFAWIIFSSAAYGLDDIIYELFGGGAVFPATQYFPMLICLFLMFSALCNGSVRKAMREWDQLCITLALTYVLQCVIL